MDINVSTIINSELAINFTDGSTLFEVIKLYDPSKIIISFVGVNRISTLFLNESIGKYAILKNSDIENLRFKYPKGKEIFEHKVNQVIENALLGDEYDNLVNNALLSG